MHTEAGLVIECLGSNGMGTASNKMAGPRAVERGCCRGREEVKVCRGEVVMLRRPSDRSVRSPASHGRTADQTLAVGTAQRSWTFDIQGSGLASTVWIDALVLSLWSAALLAAVHGSRGMLHWYDSYDALFLQHSTCFYHSIWCWSINHSRGGQGDFFSPGDRQQWLRLDGGSMPFSRTPWQDYN